MLWLQKYHKLIEVESPYTQRELRVGSGEGVENGGVSTHWLSSSPPCLGKKDEKGDFGNILAKYVFNSPYSAWFQLPTDPAEHISHVIKGTTVLLSRNHHLVSATPFKLCHKTVYIKYSISFPEIV